jgi:hypothetical protein
MNHVHRDRAVRSEASVHVATLPDDANEHRARVVVHPVDQAVVAGDPQAAEPDVLLQRYRARWPRILSEPVE